MSAPKKSAIAVLAVMGALLGTAALADKGGMGMGMGGPGEGRGAMLTEMFDSIDTDKDGFVSYEEVRAFAVKYRAERDREKNKAAQAAAAPAPAASQP